MKPERAVKLLSLRAQIFRIMDIQAEKLHLIEWLARLNDIKIIQDIKVLKKEADKDLFKRYTDRDMVNRAEASLEDVAAGRTTKVSDFKTELESWKQSRNAK
jgi:hypothetical protein